MREPNDHESRNALRSLDDVFFHEYQVAVTRVQFGANEWTFVPARPELMIEIQPKIGPAWTATFGGEEADGDFVSGLFTCPSPNALCVVVRGSGYFVRVTEAGTFHSVECRPVRHVLQFRDHGMIVFGDFAQFVAYDQTVGSVHDPEPRWRTAPLGFDDLEISRVTEDRIEGRAWNAPHQRMVPYSVDVATGRHEGGGFEELRPLEG